MIIRTDQGLRKFGDHVAQAEGAVRGIARLPDIAHAFINWRQRAVHCRNDRGKPPLLDRPAAGPEGVIIIRMQFEAPAGQTEPARNEHRQQTEDTVAGLEGSGGKVQEVSFH